MALAEAESAHTTSHGDEEEYISLSPSEMPYFNDTWKINNTNTAGVDIYKVVLSTLLSSCAVVTFFGNLLVILVFIVDRKLRTNFNLYLLNLAVTDFLVSVTAIPLFATDYILEGWPFGEVLCGVWIFMDWGMTFASIYTLVAISIDRYWAACHSVHYRSHNTRKRALLVILLIWSAEICCSYGGCFNNNSPYAHLPLPDCPSDIAPLFNVFTRSNRNSAQSLTRNSIPGVFSGSRMTVFIVHGYQSNHLTSWMHDMKDALLDRDDLNVVIVGWGNGANELYYPKSASNTRAVGAELALVMNNIKNNGGSADARIYCTGHSLGSHLCGHAGRNTNFGRITGMDPAGPMYDSYSIDASLNSGCASFVDIMHTHGQGGPIMNYGTMRILGHMDFYPNAGGLQPGCSTREVKAGRPHFYGWTADDDLIHQIDVACSHGRAHQFFIESVKRDCFIARDRCTSNTNIPGSCSSCGGQCGVMGYGARGSGSNGLYYLTTTASVPYCQN